MNFEMACQFNHHIIYQRMIDELNDYRKTYHMLPEWKDYILLDSIAECFQKNHWYFFGSKIQLSANIVNAVKFNSFIVFQEVDEDLMFLNDNWAKKNGKFKKQ
jgi:hypothetical protein